MNSRMLLTTLLALGFAGTACSSAKKSESVKDKNIRNAKSDSTLEPASPKLNRPKTQGHSWTVELAEVQSQLDARIALAQKSKSWLDWEKVALLESEKARLSGDYNCYVRAQKALDKAFALAGEGFGPFAVSAQLNMQLHRLSAAEANLQQMEKAAVLPHKDKMLILGMRADIAYHSGRLQEAHKLYSQVAKALPNVKNLSALARLLWKTGKFKEAEEVLAKATIAGEKGTRSERAWLNLMKGLMRLDQNRLDEAMVFYQEGLRLRPGYWLLEEHVAEILLEQGKVDDAMTMYVDLVERTNNPEFMNQIASIYRDKKDEANYERWKKSARDAHLKNLALVPEAAAGHALDHFLEFEEDRAKALELALTNHSTRPGGEAKEKLIAAHLLSKNLKKAMELTAEMNASGWKTADSLALSALVAELSGDTKLAKERTLEASKLAEDAEGRVEWLRESVQL